MERLKQLKECILTQTQAQMAHLDQVDTKQLGEAVDMVKDLEQAMYYCAIVKAMEESEKEGKYYYTPYRHPKDMWMDDRYPDMMDRHQEHRNGVMYYQEGGNRNGSGRGGNMNTSNPNSGSNGGSSNYYNDAWMLQKIRDEEPYYPPVETHDYRQGKSPRQRKMYMQGKQTHREKDKQMKELQKYMQDLSKDVTEMIQDSSAEQKQLLQQKLVALAKMINSNV